MWLTRLSGLKREYFASNAVTQFTAARSNADDSASPPAYCTSHIVPIARNESRRSGTAGPLGAGGGGRCDWETTAMGCSDSHHENLMPVVMTRALQ